MTKPTLSSFEGEFTQKRSSLKLFLSALIPSLATSGFIHVVASVNTSFHFLPDNIHCMYIWGFQGDTAGKEFTC